MSALEAIDTVVGKADEGDAGWVWYQGKWRLGQITRFDHPEDERLYLDLILDERAAWFHVDDPQIWGLGFYPISRPPYEGNEQPCTHALTFRDYTASWTMSWSTDEEKGAEISRSVAAHVHALLRIMRCSA